MLKHVGKHRRQWKFELKARYFNPTVRTRQQMRMTVLEELFEKYAENGREARAMLSHLHTNGSTSFANSRDEFEMEHGREPGGYEYLIELIKQRMEFIPKIPILKNSLIWQNPRLTQVLLVHLHQNLE
ncbi:Bifunctional purine biosynthesis protein PurH [Bienertia sinuspersici]